MEDVKSKDGQQKIVVITSEKNKVPERTKTQKEFPPKKEKSEALKRKNLKKKSNKSTGGKIQEKKEKGQSTLTQYFQVRRSERKPKSLAEREKKNALEKKIISGEEDGLEIRILEGKGRGVFPKNNLRRGDFVCEYAGDLITIEEAQKREKLYAENPDVGCYMYYFIYAGKKHCVDATKESGRLGRLLNHSKTKANVCTRLFPINDFPRLILVADRDIDVDEELLYDYGDRSKSAIESHPWLKT